MSDAAPPPPRRWRKRLLLGLGAGAALLLVGILLLPTLLSSGWARAAAGRRGTEAAGRHLSLGGLSVGFGATGVQDLVLRYGPGPDDPVLLRVKDIAAPAGITTALGSRYDLGTVRILGPEVRLDLRELAKPRAAPAAAAPKPTAAGGGGKGEADDGEIAPFSVKVEIREGTLIQVDDQGAESRLGTFRADLTASRDGPATLEFELDLGPAGKARIRTTAEPFASGKPRDPATVEAALAATFEAFDPAPLREAIGRAAGLRLDRAQAALTGTLEGRVTGASVEGGTVALTAKGIALAGPSLGPDLQVEEPALRLEGGFRRGADGTVDLRDASVTLAGFEARGTLSFPAGGPANGRARVHGEMRDVLPRLREFGLRPRGNCVGEYFVDVVLVGDAAGERATIDARWADAQVAPGPGEPILEEPLVHLRVDAVRTGKTVRVDEAKLRSGAAVLDGSGTISGEGPSDFRLSGQVQLARLCPILALFDAAPPGRLSGTATLEGRFLRASAAGAGAGEGDGVTATVSVADLLVAPPGEGGWKVREPRLQVSLRAVPGKDEMEVHDLRMVGAGVDLTATGTAALDLSRGKLAQAVAQVDLARWAAIADALGADLGVGLAGAARWTGPISWTRSFDGLSFDGGALEVKGLVLTVPGAAEPAPLVIREPDLRASVDAGWEGAEYRLRRVDLSLPGLKATVTGTATDEGRLALRCAGTLALADGTRRAKEMGFLSRDPAPRGGLEFDLAVRGEGAAPEIGLEKFEVRGGEIDLRASGTLALGGAADLAVQASAGAAPLLALLERAGLGKAAEGATGSLALRLRLAAPDGKSPLQVTSELQAKDLSLPDPKGGRPWAQKSVVLSADGTVDRAGEGIAGRLDLRADDGTLALQGRAACGGKAPALDATLDLDLDLSGLSRCRPEWVPIEGMVVGRVKGRAKVSGPLRTPFDATPLSGDAALDLASVRTEPLDVRDARLAAVLQGGVVTVNSLDAVVGGGKVTATAALGLAGSKPAHFLDAHAAGVAVDRPLAFLLRQVVPILAVAEKGGVSGKLKLDLRLDGAGADWEAVKPNLRGKGSLEIADGSVSGSGIVAEVLELLGGGRGLEFGSLATTFTVHDEKVFNDRLFVNGKDHSMVLNGSTSFDGKLDYRIGAKARGGMAKRLQPVLDRDGNLPFTLGGTLSKPKVRPPKLKDVLGNLAGELLGGDEKEEKK